MLQEILFKGLFFRRAMKNIMKFFSGLLFSRRCRICSDYFNAGPSFWLCEKCGAGLAPLASPALCRTCGKPLYVDFDSPAYDCGDCRDVPPPFERLRSYGFYEGSLRDLIHQFKYKKSAGLGEDLGSLLAGWMKKTVFPSDFSTVLFVPLHERKLLERGFDPAYILAAKVAREFERPLLAGALVKVRETPPQVSLSRKERLENLKGAFSSTPEAEVLKGKKTLLVDDVHTTGATLRECAGILRSIGAQGVYCVTVARA